MKSGYIRVRLIYFSASSIISGPWKFKSLCYYL